jgi:predicted molibdopterin-dependent oxidoreductase YjgC
MADIALPGFSFAEAEGTYTNVERRVQRLRAALLPAGHMRADWRIIAGVAADMTGSDWAYSAASDVFADIARAVPAYAGLSYAKLGATGVRI